MRHRLISPGGETYLPLAETAVRKLLSLGLPYADQTFVVEGFTIRVRIQPGNEYIKIEGGGVLHMDSGVADIGNIGSESLARFLPGKLYASSYYQSYTTGFTKFSGDWRTNPGKGSQGQIAGKLTETGRSSKGAIRPDEFSAVSFTPKKDPDTGELIAEDEALYLKKVITTYCPASMFTGKCRLWVQAMYGRPLYKGIDNLFSHITPGGNAGRPWLRIAGAKKVAVTRIEGGEERTYMEYPIVGVTTNCGVYLDKATGKHWFIDASDRQGTAMPLVASAAGEALRKKLKAHYAGDPELTGQDAEHLEAFILSDCRPDPTQQQTFKFAATKPVWSLGYGWHWNWSGTAADFVCNEQFEQTYIPGAGDNVALRSTHYRLTIAFSDGVFSAMSSVVQESSEWTLVPSQWCILEPNWSTGSASKLQPPYTRLKPGAATFYVYYDRDTLKTCTVEVTATESPDDFIEFTDLWMGDGDAGGPEYAMTEGMRDGHYTARTSHYAVYYTAKFNCAGETSGDLIYNRVYYEDNYSVGNKVMGDVPPGIRFDNGSLWYSGSVPYGYSPFEYQYYPAMVNDVGYPPDVTFEYKSYQKEVSYYSYAHIMPPFCDAEAMLMRTECHKYSMYSNCFKTGYSSGGFVTVNRPKIFVPGATVGAPNVDWVWAGERGTHIQYQRYGIGLSPPTTVTPTVPDPIENTDETIESVAKLTAKAHVDIVMLDRSEYSNIMIDDVQVHYEVRSGIQGGENAVVIAPAVSAQTGTAHDFYNPTIVGWA